jgi:hypothetical protein
MGFHRESGWLYVLISGVVMLSVVAFGVQHIFSRYVTISRAERIAELCDPQLELIGHVMSTPQSVAIDGNVAAVTSDANMVLLDITDPTFPRMVSQLVLPAGLSPQERQGMFLDSVVIANDHAYVTWQQCPHSCTDGGLQIVDISIPTAPVVVGSLDANAAMWDIVVLGSILYASAGGDLALIDVTDPSAPYVLATMTLDGQFAAVETIRVYVDASGHVYAFVVSTNGSFYVVDVTDSSSPFQIAAYEPPDSCMRDVALDDSGQALYAYLPDCYAGLRIVDVTSPSIPNEVHTYDFGGNSSAYRVAATGQQVVVATDDASAAWNTSLYALDVSSPITPTVTGIYTGTEYAWDMVATSGLLVVADNARGVQFVDISDPVLLAEIGRLDIVKAYGDIAVHSHYLFVVDDSGLRVIDVLNPILPHYVASFVTPYALSVTVDAGYALVTDVEGGLWVIDVSEATTPTQVGYVDTSMTSTSAVVIRGRLGGTAHAFVASHGCTPFSCPATLKVIDLSNLGAPQALTVIGDGRGISGMALSGDYLYATTGRFDSTNSDLLVLDVSDPPSSTLIHTVALQEPTLDIAVANGYAYVTTNDEIRIFDVSSPRDPVLAGSYVLVSTPKTIVIAEGLLYMTDKYDQLLILDISDPASPKLVETRTLPVESVEITTIRSLLVKDRVIYVLNNGLSVWKHRNDVLGRVRDVWTQPFSGALISAEAQSVAMASDAQVLAVSGLSGGYAATGGAVGTYTISAQMTGYGTWPLTQTVNFEPPTSGGDFYVVARPISGTLQPGISTTLGYTDTRGLPTEVYFPPDAVSQVSTVQLTPTMAFHRGDQRFVGNAFELAVVDGTSLGGARSFDTAVRITINYSDLGVLVVDEESLLLMIEVDGVWVEATSLCTEPSEYDRDLPSNVLGVSVCDTGRFALFGETNQLFLPIVGR